jgi:hypothetical protein
MVMKMASAAQRRRELHDSGEDLVMATGAPLNHGKCSNMAARTGCWRQEPDFVTHSGSWNQGPKRHTIPNPQHWGGNDRGRKRGREVMVRAEREKEEGREKFADFLQKILHLSQV